MNNLVKITPILLIRLIIFLRNVRTYKDIKTVIYLRFRKREQSLNFWTLLAIRFCKNTIYRNSLIPGVKIRVSYSWVTCYWHCRIQKCLIILSFPIRSDKDVFWGGSLCAAHAGSPITVRFSVLHLVIETSTINLEARNPVGSYLYRDTREISRYLILFMSRSAIYIIRYFRHFVRDHAWYQNHSFVHKSTRMTTDSGQTVFTVDRWLTVLRIIRREETEVLRREISSDGESIFVEKGGGSAAAWKANGDDSVTAYRSRGKC